MSGNAPWCQEKNLFMNYTCMVLCMQNDTVMHVDKSVNLFLLKHNFYQKLH